MHQSRIRLRFDPLLPAESKYKSLGSRVRSIAVSVVLIVMALYLVHAGSARAVSEEDLPPAVAPSVNPPTGPENVPSDPTSAALSTTTTESTPESPVEAPPSFQPRATFPYEVRAGDNWGSIAALFGVPVTDLIRVNHASPDSELMIGQMLRIPNPSVARERQLTGQVNQLSRSTTEAQARERQAEASLADARSRIAELSEREVQVAHDLRTLYWWRTATYLMAVITVLMLGASLFAVVDWWLVRNRFRAVAEMNESLRRLDYRYRNALARAELRLQELYGRRRRGLHEGQERARLTEEAEIESLNRELKAVLEHHLQRLGPGRNKTRRTSWEADVSEIGSPVEPRAVRR